MWYTLRTVRVLHVAFIIALNCFELQTAIQRSDIPRTAQFSVVDSKLSFASDSVEAEFLVQSIGAKYRKGIIAAVMALRPAVAQMDVDYALYHMSASGISFSKALTETFFRGMTLEFPQYIGCQRDGFMTRASRFGDSAGESGTGEFQSHGRDSNSRMSVLPSLFESRVIQWNYFHSRWVEFAVYHVGHEFDIKTCLTEELSDLVSYTDNLDRGVTYFSTSFDGLETHVPLGCFARVIVFGLNLLNSESRAALHPLVKEYAKYKSIFPKCTHVALSKQAGDWINYKRIPLKGLNRDPFAVIPILVSMGTYANRLRSASLVFSGMVQHIQAHTSTDLDFFGWNWKTYYSRHSLGLTPYVFKMILALPRGAVVESNDLHDATLLSRLIDLRIESGYNTVMIGSALPFKVATLAESQLLCLIYIQLKASLRSLGRTSFLRSAEL